MRVVGDAVRQAARRHGVRGHVAEEIAYDALAAAGVFNEPPQPEPDTCTAQYLPHDPDAYEPDMLGVWQQCEDDPGHDGRHDAGEASWPEGAPGSIPPGAPS
ncbi:hypothetical protein [Streptomyces sindenensis]|uniref:Uncharacterized protein n=3 Tax=Streptomyces TaxID=1883 RepID=A0ABW6EQX9_9ACTN